MFYAEENKYGLNARTIICRGGRGITGYWLLRGFFRAYVDGRQIGSFADPCEAQRAINARLMDTGARE
jgi:hypothetical protein